MVFFFLKTKILRRRRRDTDDSHDWGYQGFDFSQAGKVRFLDALGPVLDGVREMEGIIGGAIGSLKSMGRGGPGDKIMVILDGLDFMMAANGAGAGEMLEMVGRIREVGLFICPRHFSSALSAPFSVDYIPFLHLLEPFLKLYTNMVL